MSDRLINGNEAGNDLQTGSNGAMAVSRALVYAEHMKDNLRVLAWTRPDFLCRHMGNRRGMCASR